MVRAIRAARRRLSPPGRQRRQPARRRQRQDARRRASGAAAARRAASGRPSSRAATRGRRRRRASRSCPTVAGPGRLRHAGDEPLMLARALPGVPVLVGADRYRVGPARRGAFRRHGPPAGRWVPASSALARDVDLLLVERRRSDRSRAAGGPVARAARGSRAPPTRCWSRRGRDRRPIARAARARRRRRRFGRRARSDRR